VSLYGAVGGGRTRAELRRPGALDGLKPDFGPRTHPTAGATLVAARPPLIAFNVEVDAPLETAREIARGLRSDHVKALGLRLESTGVVQVSTNIEDHTRTTGAELVAPAPRAALADFPKDVPLKAPAPLEDHLPS
jgi:glutamate formiminotransferase